MANLSTVNRPVCLELNRLGFAYQVVEVPGYSADMKAALATMIYAAYLLKELKVPLLGRIGLCLVADEETGGQGGSRYLEQIGLLGQNAIAMLTPEPTGGVISNANWGAITLCPLP